MKPTIENGIMTIYNKKTDAALYKIRLKPVSGVIAPVRYYVDLSYLDLRKAALENYDWSFAKFNRSNVAKVDFTGSILAYTEFYDATCTEANFTGCNVSHARFDGAACTHTHFTDAICHDTSFRYTTLWNSNFHGALLHNVENNHFEGADLRHLCLWQTCINKWMLNLFRKFDIDLDYSTICIGD